MIRLQATDFLLFENFLIINIAFNEQNLILHLSI